MQVRRCPNGTCLNETNGIFKTKGHSRIFTPFISETDLKTLCAFCNIQIINIILFPDQEAGFVQAENNQDEVRQATAKVT